MKVNIKKLAVSAMLTAVAVSLSGFSIPIGHPNVFRFSTLPMYWPVFSLGRGMAWEWRSAHPLSGI